MQWVYESFRDSYIFPHCERSVSTRFHERPIGIHLHHNIELLYIIEGSLELDLYDTDRHTRAITLRKDDVILINCNILHETHTNDHVDYILGLIPPNCLTPPLHIDVGKTYEKAYHDEEGLILPMLKNLDTFSSPDYTDAFQSVICTSIANTVMGILLPRMRDYAICLRGGALKSDILTYVYKNYRNPELSADNIAQNFGYSTRYLSSIFKDNVGTGLKGYITMLRINDAKDLLSRTSQSVESIAYTVGFESSRSFFRVFHSETGITPGEWRERNSLKDENPDKKRDSY